MKGIFNGNVYKHNFILTLTHHVYTDTLTNWFWIENTFHFVWADSNVTPVYHCSLCKENITNKQWLLTWVNILLITRNKHINYCEKLFCKPVRDSHSSIRLLTFYLGLRFVRLWTISTAHERHSYIIKHSYTFCMNNKNRNCSQNISHIHWLTCPSNIRIDVSVGFICFNYSQCWPTPTNTFILLFVHPVFCNLPLV